MELSLTAFTDKTGAVTGVLVKGKHSGLYQINAKAVVLAPGGIGANAKRVQSLRPDIGADVKTSNQPGSQGDGMVLAQKIGASVTDAKEIELNPTLLVGSPVIVSETVRGAGAVFVNKEGNTIRELAAAAGIDPDNLEKTMTDYNRYAENGKDPEFHRPDGFPKVDKPKYYAIEITPAIHYYMGGLTIDGKTRVINTKGQPIKGLFAAGEVTGGVHGKNRLGGNSISETITFGRIAGTQAVKTVKQ